MPGWKTELSGIHLCCAKFMQECGPSTSRVYCIFAKSANRSGRIKQLLR